MNEKLPVAQMMSLSSFGPISCMILPLLALSPPLCGGGPSFVPLVIGHHPSSSSPRPLHFLGPFLVVLVVADSIRPCCCYSCCCCCHHHAVAVVVGVVLMGPWRWWWCWLWPLFVVPSHHFHCPGAICMGPA
jgi:hypothetical protein